MRRVALRVCVRAASRSRPVRARAALLMAARFKVSTFNGAPVAPKSESGVRRNPKRSNLGG